MRIPRSQLLLSLISAVFGAIVAIIWCSTPNHGPAANAQEPFRIVDQQNGAAPTVRLVPSGGETDQASRPIGPGHIIDGMDELTPEERTHVAVYESCNRSVVNIKTEVAAASLFLIDMIQEGAGSGSVLDKQGHVLTNYHVVENAREIQVTLFDSKDYIAKVVGRDATTDVCVLKIDAPADSLYPVRFGDSSRLKVGQRVYAIGNPFSFERTMTTGIVSSLNRTLPSRDAHRSIKSIIQIDAAINPGNSGGPLLDSHGRLIGMNTAIASKTGQSTGVGFAIPASHISRVVPELITTGHVVRPEHGIHKVVETEHGLMVVSLVPNGPAEKAGLRGVKITKERKRQGVFTYESTNVDRNAADVIVAVDDQPVTKADDFLSIVDSHRPGDEVALTVNRQGRQTPVRMKLGAGE